MRRLEIKRPGSKSCLFPSCVTFGMPFNCLSLTLCRLNGGNNTYFSGLLWWLDEILMKGKVIWKLSSAMQIFFDIPIPQRSQPEAFAYLSKNLALGIGSKLNCSLSFFCCWSIPLLPLLAACCRIGHRPLWPLPSHRQRGVMPYLQTWRGGGDGCWHGAGLTGPSVKGAW